MEKEQLHIGMKILLSLDCTYTKDYFGWNENMDKYQGIVQKIESITRNRIRIRCYGTGYNWSIKDMSPAEGNSTVENDKNLKLIYFNQEELVL